MGNIYHTLYGALKHYSIIALKERFVIFLTDSTMLENLSYY